MIGVTTPPIRPARPQHAASLVAVRLAQGQPEVLMGRRRAKARFAPDAWVFPGGKLDAADRCVQPARDLESAVIANLGLPAPKARALAIAALRETAEETGLLIGTPGRLEGPENLTSCAWAAYRAIVFGVLAATLICLLIVTSFVGAFFELGFARAVGGLLVLAMFAAIAALGYFLVEIRIAAQNLPNAD